MYCSVGTIWSLQRSPGSFQDGSWSLMETSCTLRSCPMTPSYQSQLQSLYNVHENASDAELTGPSVDSWLSFISAGTQPRLIYRRKAWAVVVSKYDIHPHTCLHDNKVLRQHNTTRQKHVHLYTVYIVKTLLTTHAAILALAPLFYLTTVHNVQRQLSCTYMYV